MTSNPQPEPLNPKPKTWPNSSWKGSPASDGECCQGWVGNGYHGTPCRGKFTFGLVTFSRCCLCAKAHIARVYEVQLWAVESVMNHDVAFDHRCPDLLSFRTSATCGISCVTSLRSACAASGGATSLRMLSGLGLRESESTASLWGVLVAQ